jgi:hypothetical protein
MKVRILKQVGQGVAVSFREPDGTYRAVVINRDRLLHKTGTDAEVTFEVIENEGVEYGLDFETFLSSEGLTITPQMIQNAMRAHGIWTLEDLLKNQQEALAAVLGVARFTLATLTRLARKALGG